MKWFISWLQWKILMKGNHYSISCKKCEFYTECKNDADCKTGKVIVELPRTPANAWLFEYRTTEHKENKISER